MLKSLFPLLPMVGLCALSLIWGGFAVLSGVFPGRQLDRAYQGAQALLKVVAHDATELDPYRWTKSRFRESGLVRIDQEKVVPGYTLYTSGRGERAILVDLHGDTVHEWRLPYHSVWEPGFGVPDPRPPGRIFWRKAHLFPNGDLLALVVGTGSTPWGHGLLRMDADSKLQWKLLEPVHHDFDLTDDGRIFTLTHRLRTEPHPVFRHLTVPLVEDFLLEVGADGRKRRELALLDAFVNAPFNDMFQIPTIDWTRSPWGEYCHANSVHFIDDRDAAVLPFAERGQVLVSLAQLYGGTAVLLDVDREKAVWGLRGPWSYQHDVEVLDNGNLLLFDNFGQMAQGGLSRVLEVDPVTSEIEWSYQGNPREVFSSELRAAQQRLRNGNTLITESNAGRIFEVTRAGEIVWEYINPDREGENGKWIAVVCFATRYEPDELDAAFLGRLRSSTTPHPST